MIVYSITHMDMPDFFFGDPPEMPIDITFNKNTMITENFELGPIRPPDEADSLLIRTTRGCPWNHCAFCTLYKGVQFSIRTMEEIKADILAAQAAYNGHPFEKCFLQDGDSFAMKTRDLVEILRSLKSAFPSLKQISSYGRAQTMGRKSSVEMQEIAGAGLNVLYCGMESGSDEVLKKVRKGVSSESILESTLHAKSAGMEILLFTILGLGGKELTDSHARGTARLIDDINPKDIRILSLAVKQDTPLEKMVKDGTFTVLSEVEMIEEQQIILGELHHTNSNYGNYHGVNLLVEVQGKIPENKQQMLATIERFLTLDTKQQLNFIYGRRRGYYSHLQDMQQNDRYALVENELRNYQEKRQYRIEDFFHQCRKNWI